MQNERKLILSRKGFDSANGGCPSPILPDGTMLSLPIPVAREPLPGDFKFHPPQLEHADIFYGDMSYDEIWYSLRPGRKVGAVCCHLDPDIRPVRRLFPVENWRPAFGQCGAAETELRNNGVSPGDLFLFFGLFRPTEQGQGRPLQYVRHAAPVHAVYGYLQIGRILRGDAIRNDFPWHPHAQKAFEKYRNNTLYLPAEQLILNGVSTPLPGYGTFDYAEDLVLTKPGLSPSRWKLHDWMKGAHISHHSATSVHEDYFQSASIGQEFVVHNAPKAIEWAGQLLRH